MERENQRLKKYIAYCWFLFGFVFLVILAGGIVRMTQSGMGCPDWPKCFGMWIPPVNESQLPLDFEQYLDKQDIDHSFNVYHTWIEYINRLLGAILGLLILIFVALSFRIRRIKPKVFYLSILLFLLVGFQGWLGKRVVDENLAVAKITTHMVVAILIAAVPLIIVALVQMRERVSSRLLKWVSSSMILLVLLQIFFGTRVRESIDIVSKSLNYEQRELWIADLGTEFLVHRSYTWILLIGTVILIYYSTSNTKLSKARIWVVGSLIITVAAGLIMSYADMPALAQPIHLVFASLLTMSLLWFRLQVK